MKLTCPGCGALGSIEQFTADREARAFMATLVKLPAGLGEPVLNYLSLFRPPKRALAWSRARRLLVELAPLMEAAAVRRHGRDWRVTPDMWRRGIEQMLERRDTLTLPLKSHGYLLEIVAGLASKAEGDVETQKEAQLRSGFRSGEQASQASYERLLVNSENAARKQLGQFKMTPREQDAFLSRERARA
jgi:hypothetical protein